ncbi:cysteine--1-D-myo-inosityl 2-amino-2-deoxy-alpha-D-glucopyranoside ligase [Corynebacterium poyangense]|uniref:L-cysteine:1D-myo-inositol 2-amino-2-deoxy-alpha-D-glucopyranoside ligase n=1 Tax=Corynebacterium poyangense TaxID=2684405 RepID=A0A7H0SNV9_9CORY|nr:cysteine--1-D-myo-inosityl 2-amino-2-deoxy-alpha-D-glucopyranoside ligase [Corynebacterium poyangense]MBZ8177790.1 cysteine--1-D-myo-inosityl 2-amino-2-deoxy-alpha-D-glucopyranoside ligase [Corynebacterium poyangense]QNQ90234.1 cysteine--1-D-myo-inosityl 2-amino-2-deoxy-alpha-D-glucopyranoside ligase [Corynebacterium poyangense]
MKSWPYPSVPKVPGSPVPLVLFDTADNEKREVERGNPTGMYVCGITPYDSTHLGHAATYLAFDLIYRQLLDNGHDVHYVQNITDVDDPLFERAARDGVDWKELGTSQIDLFRSDMEELRVLPPQHYIGAMEAIDEVITMVQQLLDCGAAYIVDDVTYPDIYASISATRQFGYESGYSRELMEKFFAERGGDPDRPGKKDSLDALVWRAHRPGEPAWEAPFGAGRPGWHVECSAIATNRLGPHFAIQGGGSDLIFPHHEFSAAHAESALGTPRMAGHYVHAGMISLDGVKMSKSLGNLVFVHKLTQAGHEANAIRLGVYARHYRGDRDWSAQVLAEAEQRLSTWRNALQHPGDTSEIAQVIHEVRTRLADDLDSPGALQVIDDWAARHQTDGQSNPKAQELLTSAVDALLGVNL